MGSHPINLFFRFVLELSALAAMGVWGWQQGEGWLRLLLALGIPIIAAILWGTFAVPDDPSRSGKAPIAVPGILRLLLELVFFIFATWALYDVGFSGLSWALGLLVTIHYLASYDRILWLVKK
ncbi:MAG: YrdB family protein [Chloroflexi bacterium]|nr:YrdB family protein [Chloroflexota bacterium]